MLARFLPPELVDLVADERQLLGDVQALLAQDGTDPEAQRTLAASVRQLDELFMVVVVGEFNSGKSALVNALLGDRLLEEGVTPTTAAIHLVQHGESSSREAIDGTTQRLREPIDLLRDVTIVDTPGTNALDREHEALTTKFVPRSDLVLFVTSADRPFSESERTFLERIREWGKKIIIVVNKVDILAEPQQVEEIRTFVVENARTLLGIVPQIFLVSARDALVAQAADDREQLQVSGLPPLETHLRDTLDDSERLRLKLLNPLGVADRLLSERLDLTTNQLGLLADDLETIRDIKGQLETYGSDIDREFNLRLADMDNALHLLEKRGLDFFDDTVRLTRFTELLRKDELRERFEREVIAEAPQQIETKVESLIDWLVESDLNQWQAVVQHVNRRRVQHEERIVGEIGGRFEIDRSNLLNRVATAARKGLDSYDRSTEARRMAEGVQNALAGTALVEAGAVGLGATIAYIASGTAVDASGFAAAGLLAVLGLFILPARRRRAKNELKEKIATMRDNLMATVTAQFTQESEAGRAQIRETVAPYTRFVRSEQERLTSHNNELKDLRSRAAIQQDAIKAIEG
ncbi:MAG: GTP-binding protein [bacterium]|nr:GTP-binding protein [bacterium]